MTQKQALDKTIDLWHGRWKYHIQQMAIDPEPLQYIAKFLKEGDDNEKARQDRTAL